MTLPVVYSTRKAREQAERLGLAVVENAVEREIAAGNVSAGARGGFIFHEGKEWVARAIRKPAKIETRRCWLVVSVEPYREESQNGF